MHTQIIVTYLDFELAIHSKVGDTRNEPPLRAVDFTINLRPSLVTVEPFLDLCLVESTLHSPLSQNTVIGNVLILLKVGIEQLLDDPSLRCLTLGLGQLDNAMCVPGVACLAAKSEIDADLASDLGKANLHHLGSLGAKLALVEFLLVYGLFRRVWVQIEGCPCCGEGV